MSTNLEQSFESLVNNFHPDLLAALKTAPELPDPEFGAVVEQIVVHALHILDDLPDEVLAGNPPSAILNVIMGAWLGGLSFEQVLPLRREAATDFVQAGMMPIPTCAVNDVLEEMPWIARSPMSVIIEVTNLVLLLAPAVSREEQAAAVVALLRQLDGWLPGALGGLHG